MYVYDYEVIKTIDYIFCNHILIYGTGLRSRELTLLLKQIGVEPEAYILTKKEQTAFMGKKVYTPLEAKKMYDKENSLMVLGSYDFYLEMYNNMQKQNFRYLKVCTIYAVFYSIYLNYRDSKIDSDFSKVLYWRMMENQRKHFYYYQGVFSDWIYKFITEPDKVLVYQPGKVGSSSINLSAPKKCQHLHSLVIYSSFPHVDIRQYNELQNIVSGRKIRIISGVRSPIERDLSGFLQSTELSLYQYPSLCCNPNEYLWYGDYINNSIIFDESEYQKRSFIWQPDMIKSCKTYLQKMIQLKTDEFSWFDYEIASFLGVDIYQYPFDKAKGYSIIQQGNVEILLYRLDKLNTLSDIIGQFLGLPHFLLHTENTGKEKIYSYLYQQIKDKIVLDSNYVDYYFRNNVRVNHFFSKEEQQQLLEKWKGRII